MQELDGKQRRTIIEPRRRVRRQRRRYEFDKGQPEQEEGVRPAAPDEQKQREYRRRRNLDHAREREIRAENLGHGEIDGARQHRRLKRERSGLAQHQRRRAQARDPRHAGADRLARFAEPRREGPGQQNEKQHAAHRHRLRDDGEAVQNDREIAEQVDEQRHGQGAVTVKGTFPRVICPSTASTCQRTE